MLDKIINTTMIAAIIGLIITGLVIIHSHEEYCTPDFCITI